MEIKVGTFTWSAGASGDQAVTGVGFQPVAVIIFASRATAYSSFLEETLLSIGYGVGAGVANNKSAIYASRWNTLTNLPQAAADTRDNEMISEIGANGAAGALATLKSLDSDGFTLTGSLADDGQLYQYLAIGGDDVSAKVGKANWNTSTGTQAITGVGFTPTVVLCMGIVETDGAFFHGWCDGQLRQGCSAFHFEDAGTSPTNSHRYQTTSKALVLLNPSTGAVAGEAAVTSLDSDGFTLNWSTAYGVADEFVYLCLAGVTGHAGSMVQPSTAQDQEVTDLDTEPLAVLLQSSLQTVAAGVQDNLGYAFGFGQEGANYGTYQGDVDNVSTDAGRRSIRYSSNAEALIAATPTGTATGSVAASASIASLNAAGFTATWSAADATAREILYLAIGGAPAVEPTPFTLLDAHKGSTGPIYHAKIVHVDTSGTAAEFVWAPITLADPPSYYGGLKTPRLLAIGAISCPLSDITGRLQIPTLDITFSDVPDNSTGLMPFRGMLGRDAQRHLYGAEITIYATTNAARLALEDQAILFRGFIHEYGGEPDYQFSIQAYGWIAKRLSESLWTDTIGDVFSLAPSTTRNITLPLALGSLSDEGSATDPPVFSTDEAVYGGGFDGDGYPFSGYGYLGRTAPSWIAAVETTGGNLTAGLYYVQMTQIVGGLESDPTPHLPAGYDITVSAGAGIKVTGPNSGATAYRFYLGQQRAGGGEVLFLQYIQTTDPVTGVIFTDHDEDPVSITSGASYATSLFGWMRVVAVMTDGDTAPSEQYVFVRTTGYFRPIRFSWEPVASALSYKVYYGLGAALASTAEAFAVFSVPTTQTNGNGDPYLEWTWGDTSAYVEIDKIPTPEGIIAPVYCGTFTDNDGFAQWHGWIVSCRPCTNGTLVPYLDGTRVSSANFSTTWAVPGQGQWTTKFGPNNYYSVGSKRLWMIFIFGPDAEAVVAGTKTLRVNVDGLETNGDGSGTCITSIYDQFARIANNVLLPDTASLDDAFNQSPTFSDGSARLDSTQLTTAASDALRVMPSGPAGARWLPGSQTGEVFLQEWAQSAGARIGIRPNGQVVVAVHNTSATPTATLDERKEIIKSSYSFRATTRGYAKKLTYSYGPKYDSPTSFTYSGTGEQGSGSPALALIMPWRIALATAVDVAASAFALARYLPQQSSARSVLHWTQFKPGEHASLTHRQGPAETGYTSRLHAITGMSIDLSSMTTTLSLLDLAPGGVGNATAAPAAGSVVLTGTTPTLRVGPTTAPGAGSLVYTGTTPTSIVTGPTVLVVLPAGSLVLTGLTPTVA